ncbi:hypothetical protein [Sinorhizobium fredii]|uniref:hypothetical protein n=1 Tax=Rhizobium fredii TaxID=380 RepID=UPI000CF20B3F|nr:hypothetical protein [Sinorhizobium fredii]
MDRGAFEQAGRWLDDHKTTIALLVSGIGLSVIKDLGVVALDGDQNAWARIASAVAVIGTVASAWYGGVSQAKLAGRNRELEQQLDDANELVRTFGSDYFAIWDNRLKVLAEVLNLDARDRVSVYRHTGNSFTMVGRFAMLPELDRPGRGVYPVDQGVIGAAWSRGDGKCVVQDLPDPVHDLDGYCARSRDEWKLPAGVVKKLGMKARSIAAFALNGHADSVRDAIVVFESNEADRFSIELLEHHIYGTTGKDIAHLLKVMGEREPSLDFAATRGF